LKRENKEKTDAVLARARARAREELTVEEEDRSSFPSDRGSSNLGLPAWNKINGKISD